MGRLLARGLFCSIPARISVFLLGVGLAIASPPLTLTTVHSFDFTDGESPSALVQGTDGNFYGTTYYGGSNSSCSSLGCGTVFKITPAGTLKTLYNFCAQTGCTDGSVPVGLVLASNGNLYGTTQYNGANGYGTVFEITEAGKLTTLHSFDWTDVAQPNAGLVQAANGSFYGTTFYGGANGYGTVFEITGSNLTTRYSFCAQANCADGEYPKADLVQGIDGNFYGTTYGGGANGYGTVFKMSATGKLTTLYSFCSQTSCTDGVNPVAGLVQAANQNFYGTIYGGGAHGVGTVFKMTRGGALTTLYSFCSQSNCIDGANPAAGLVLATNGKFYGTTEVGGAHGRGTFFGITGSGTLTTVYNFCSQTNCTDGSYPASLLQATNGIFYGITDGGEANYGTIFRLSIGLGPFVKTLPTSGKVGAHVIILGNNLQGATSVTFNGKAATFTASNSEVKTSVPSGATTGIVEVTTPTKTLKSNLVFRVTK